MANIVVNIDKSFEDGTDGMRWLTLVDRALHVAPEMIAALSNLIGAIEKPLSESCVAGANPINIPLDITKVAELKAVLPELKTFLGSLGAHF